MRRERGRGGGLLSGGGRDIYAHSLIDIFHLNPIPVQEFDQQHSQVRRITVVRLVWVLLVLLLQISYDHQDQSIAAQPSLEGVVEVAGEEELLENQNKRL